MSDTTELKLGKPWEKVKERIKESEMSLTDEDLQYEPGQEQKLLARLAKKLNKSPEDVKGWIESVSSNTAQAG